MRISTEQCERPHALARWPGLLALSFAVGAGLGVWDIWRQLPEATRVAAAPAAAQTFAAQRVRIEPHSWSAPVSALEVRAEPPSLPPTLGELARDSDAATRAEAEIVLQLIAAEESN